MSSGSIDEKQALLHRVSEQSDLRLGEKGSSTLSRSGEHSKSQSPSNSIAPSERSAVTTNETLIERGKAHGNATDQFALAQHIKEVLRSGKNWESMTDQQIETLEMASTKLSRILTGDPNHLDHWKDCAGYFELCALIMEGKHV